ncbi:MAG TPA: transporter, partial [Verrucomicrobiae bacterium]|nr:transporter [Verrucomicrobiae bacterium]
MKKAALAASVAVILYAGAAHAAHPLATEDTGTVEKGKYQLELSTEVGRAGGSASRETATEFAASFTAGLTDRIDLSLGLPFDTVRERDPLGVNRHSGLGDAELASKIRFLESGRFSLAVRPAVTMPLGDEDRVLGGGRISYGASLIASTDLKPFGVHAVVGYARNNNAGERRDIVSASAAATAEVGHGVQLVAEVV